MLDHVGDEGVYKARISSIICPTLWLRNASSSHYQHPENTQVYYYLQFLDLDGRFVPVAPDGFDRVEPTGDTIGLVHLRECGIRHFRV